MASVTPHPHLRIVGTDDPVAVARWARHRSARTAVSRETRAASANQSLDPADPRWVLAMRAYSQLQGSTLTPDRRERVLDTARRLGVRPFDANVIIAMVQDRARRGEPIASAAPTLDLLADPRMQQRRGAWRVWLLAITTAAALTFVIIRWIAGG
ncbi:MAG: hypothetical protein ACYTGG_09020 [Planctomycetota bacterium]|jgi:hypothetical protein